MHGALSSILLFRLLHLLLISAVLACLSAVPVARATMPLNLARLAVESGWIRLLHYEPDRGVASGWRSAIHSPEFFLAASGATDPLAELQATLAAMSAPAGSEVDAHTQCRFPARRIWLAQRLKGAAPFAPIACPRFDGFIRNSEVESVSIIFATGYLGNPASYYGHALLKFNYTGPDSRSPLLDVSVNYGAILTGTDDPLTYMLKGVFGGYDGGFSHVHYYFHNHNYGENELRDLWEYRLDLPPEAVRLIVAHAWEVLGQRYTYYFFRRNCAFRMAEIVQVVDGVDITPPDRPWTVPQAMIQRLAQARFAGRPLLAEARYHPSRQSRFYEKYRSLEGEDAHLLGALAGGAEAVSGPRFQGRPVTSRQAVLDGLIDYYQFVADPETRARGKLDPGYARALAARYRLPPGAPAVTPRLPEPPHLGRPPGWVQAGWMHGSASGEALSLRLRPAYYDVLDTGSGHVANGALVMGDVQLRVEEGRVRLQQFDLLAIESVNPALSGLPGDRGAAWKLRAGIEQARLACRGCLVPRLQGDMGLGRQLREGLFAAVYAGGAVQVNRFDQGPGFIRASASLIFKPADSFALRLGYEHRQPVGSAAAYGLSQAEFRLAVGARSDLRIAYGNDDARLLTIGLGHYW